jgi:hypothetical protein
MKIINNHIKISAFMLFALLTLALSGCKDLDNYDAPAGGLHGTIMDASTNEPIPLPVQGSSGVIINLFEQNTSATKSIDFYAKDNGTYENSQVFNGEYRVVVNGPFVQVAENTVVVKGQTELNFTAVPYSRIEATAVAAGKSVTVTYKVTPSSPEFKTTEVYGYWNFAPGIDNSGSNYAEKLTSANVTGTMVFNMENSSVFKSNLYKITNNGNKVYFRIGAKTNGIVNYSKTILLTL